LNERIAIKRLHRFWFLLIPLTALSAIPSCGSASNDKAIVVEEPKGKPAIPKKLSYAQRTAAFDELRRKFKSLPGKDFAADNQVMVDDFDKGVYDFIDNETSWDVMWVTVEPRTGLAAFNANEAGASALYLLKSGRGERLKLPLGIISGLKFAHGGHVTQGASPQRRCQQAAQARGPRHRR
jgi:hypothetical protein